MSTTNNSLATSITTTEPDQIASLHLIADSIAQQRQLAARSMLTHPAVLSCLTFTLFITYFFTRALSTTGEDNWPYLLLITWPACITVYLLAAAHTTHPYLEKAGRTGTWVWLWRGGTRYKHRRREPLPPPQSPPPSASSSPSTSRAGYKTPVKRDHHSAEDNEEEEEEDIMVVTKYHNRVIGTLVLRIIRTEEELWGHVRDAVVREELYQTPSIPGTGSTTSTSSGSCQPVGVIRAWTVEQHLRGVGVGRNLLENAIRICRERGIKGPVFSDCHANEVLGLPIVCNGELVRRERRAREMLEGVKREVEEMQAVF
ncbi:inorganic phosphate transporter pho84 [Aspergillus niger]|nr:inorganic phosphate transporter pho84 [Aspergillus niger]